MSIEFFSINTLPSILKSFFDNNEIPKEISPYQYPSWQEKLVENYFNSNMLKYLVKAEYCVYKKNGAEAIFPYQYKRFSKDGDIMLFGSGGMSDYLNLIYNEQFSFDDFCSILHAVTNKTGCKQFYFNLIQENTRVYDYIRCLSVLSDECNACVHIELPISYDEYYKSLSKSTRQNIRTSLNRIEKAGLRREFCLLSNSDISQDMKKEMVAVYQERYRKKNKDVQFSIVQKIKTILIHGSHNLISDALGQTDGTIVAAEYIEGKLAAYAFILLGNNKKIVCVPRVATAEEFYFYSTGMLLFIDLIQNIFQKSSFVESVSVLDLTNGDEDYKFKLGGISDNPTHRIRFEANNI